MDTRSPLQWNSPDEHSAKAAAAIGARERSPFYDGLIAGALVASIGYSIVLVVLSLVIGGAL